MSGGVTTDFSNSIRDVSPAYETLRVAKPRLISRIRVGSKATNTKHEWQEESVASIADTISAVSTNLITISDTAQFKVGDVVRFTSSGDLTLTEKCLVAALNSATTMTLTRAYAGSTGITLASGQNVILQSRPQADSSDAETGDYSEASMEYNYTEIYDETAQVSKSAQAQLNYSFSDNMAKQEAEAFERIIRKQNNSIIWGDRFVSGTKRTAGGLIEFLSQSGGNVIAGGSAALTPAKINSALSAIADDGADGGNYLAVMNTNQSQVVSAFNSSIIETARTDSGSGSLVTTFKGDIALDGGFNVEVFVDQNMAKDQVMILNMDKISINPYRTFTAEDGAANASDYFRTRILGEYTLTVENAKQSHAIINALSI